MIVLDFETRSEVDLRKVGAWAYAHHESTEILMCAYYDPKEHGSVQIAIGEEAIKNIPGFFDPNVKKVAHNAQFERYMIKGRFGVLPEPETFIDTAAYGVLYGLPRSLKDMANALNVEAKDEAGTRLINLFSKPQKRGMKWRDINTNTDEYIDFVNYCKQDVWVTYLILKKLAKMPYMQTPEEKELYHLSERINDKGVPVDVPFTRTAARLVEETISSNKKKFEQMTGVDNANSRQQVMSWLESEGVEVGDKLDKDAISDYLANGTVPSHVKEALEVKRTLTAGSLARFQTLADYGAVDGAIHGCFQYAGAHTGRYAGKGINFQNLPNGSFDNDNETLEAMDKVRHGQWLGSEDMKKLIRASIDGGNYGWIVSDFSAIEARVVAWLAGEQWVLDTFEAGKDIYVQTASMMFGVSYDEAWQYRKQGKVAVLACLAEGTKVLTKEHGLVPIEKITRCMEVWDGVEWVSHDGLLYKGMKHVITYQGLRATPNHKVWVKEKTTPVTLEYAATRGLRLLRTGVGGQAIRVSEGDQTIQKRRQSARSMRRLRRATLGVLEQPTIRENVRVPRVLKKAEIPVPTVVGTTCNSAKTTLPESRKQGVQTLRWARHNVRLPQRPRSVPMGRGKPRDTRRRNFRTRQNRQQQRLRTRKPTMVYKVRAKLQQANLKPQGRTRLGILPLLAEHSRKEATRWTNKRRNYQGSPVSRQRETKKLAYHTEKVRVFDILNAGKRHRFTANNVLVSNCGYSGGQGAIEAFSGDTFTREERQDMVDKYRQANPNIRKFWYTAEKAFWHGGKAGEFITVEVHGATRKVILPSGRAIFYHDVRKEPRIQTFHDAEGNPYRKKVMTLLFSKGGKTDTTTGGRLVENWTQAVARDLLGSAMLRLDKHGHDIRMHVHDEVLVLAKEGTTEEEITSLMSVTPDYAPGLPIEAGTYRCKVYRKE